MKSPAKPFSPFLCAEKQFCQTPLEMAFESFRDFIQRLDHAGELICVREPVVTELEITEPAGRQMKSPGGGKALLIEKPTVNGEIVPFPLAINTMGSWKRMALSLNAATVDEIARELESLVKAKPPTSTREAMKLPGTPWICGTPGQNGSNTAPVM